LVTGKISGLLSLTLIASSALGLQILATDTWLWTAATSHALGLAVFTVFDLFLAATVLWKSKLAILGLVLASVELAAMTADMFVGAPMGVPQAVFRNYLQSNSAFSVLLWIQPVIIGIAIVAFRFRSTTILDKKSGISTHVNVSA
jgi:hypothetical protein